MTLGKLDNEQVLRHIRWRSIAHFLGDDSSFPRLLWAFVIFIMVLVALHSRDLEPRTWIPSFLWVQAAVSCAVWVLANARGNWAVGWAGYYSAWIALCGIVVSSPATMVLGYVLMLVGLALSALDMPSRSGFMTMALWAAVVLMAVEQRELYGVLSPSTASMGLLIFVLISVLLLQSLSFLENLYKRGFCDDLTGVGSRQLLRWMSKTALMEAQKRGESVSLLLLDLDNFKQVNDQGGHALGDTVLGQLARFIQREVRGDDVVCRYGGDEFAILMKNTDHESAVAAAQRLRKRVAEVFSRELSEYPVSVSIGVATYPEHGTTLAELLTKADQALMSGAKLRGRNRVATANAFYQGNPWQMLQGVLSPSMMRLLEIAMQVSDESVEHMTRLVPLAEALGAAVGLPEEMQLAAVQAAALHDVGCIAVPREIRTKWDPLDVKGYHTLMRHADVGADILANLGIEENITRTIRHHHEWWNGTGYPDGLRGEEIPITSAILAVVEAYDIMLRPGPHGRVRTPTEAVQEILRLSGLQFNPYVASQLPKVLELAT
ncbi:MAG TPA: diguanylate cyclase [Firmicutes bacterium]|nr:diguanylate cyclase [Bacillota bacterium]